MPRPESKETARIGRIREALTLAIESPECELDHRNAWELLVATILSAQTTDERVNMVTPSLFERWPDPGALAAASQEDVEAVVRTTGFFRNKAKAIRGAAAVVSERFLGQVPKTLEEAVEIPGVARKTANLVIGTAYHVPTGIAVDTHVGRVARRLGLTTEEDPVKVERDLCQLFPKEEWIDMGHRLLLHGRYVCVAKKPRCGACPLNELCPSREADPSGTPEERAAAEGRRVASREK